MTMRPITTVMVSRWEANGRKMVWLGMPRSIRQSHRKARDISNGLIIQQNMVLFFSGERQEGDEGEGEWENLERTVRVSLLVCLLIKHFWIAEGKLSLLLYTWSTLKGKISSIYYYWLKIFPKMWVCILHALVMDVQVLKVKQASIGFIRFDPRELSLYTLPLGLQSNM